MPRVYRSSVKETTHKAPPDSPCPHPHPPYQAQPAAEDAAHTAAEEAGHTVAAHTDTLHDIEVDTPAPDNAVNTVSGPPSGIDSSVTMRPPQHQPYQVMCPPSLPLPRPGKGGRTACFSLCALLVELCTLPHLGLSLVTSGGL